jgi:hypothetical protein
VGFTVGSNAPSVDEQEPPTQAEVAAQTTPQPPQLLGSVVVLVQPAVQQVWLPVQAGPPLQVVGATQAPFTQVSLGAQGLPQAPQFLGSLLVFEQPEGQHWSVPVQAGPPWQVAVHALLTHMLPATQVMPQPPQLSGSLVVSAQPRAQHWRLPVHTGPPLQVAVQVPPTQLAPAGQALPQTPQLLGSVSVEEHPVWQHCWVAAQAGPPLQVVVVLHMLLMHWLPKAQTMPQPPQLFGSLVGSEHPLGQHCCMPLQTEPPLHLVVHTLIWQSLPGGQAKPHEPQFWESLVVSLQPDLQHVWVPAQAGPPLQDWVQRPITQLLPGAQVTPQKPQLLGSLLSSTHTPPQLTVGAWQIMPPQAPPPSVNSQQAPFWQTLKPGGQTTPQPPQLLMSLVVSTQVVPALQQVSTPGQPVIVQFPVVIVQKPLTQESPPGQTLPQKPQLLGSLPVLTSQPSGILPSQSAKPGLQAVIAQAALWHEVDPLGTGPQAMPQPPQLLSSAVTLAQRTPQQTCVPGQPVAPQGPTHWPPEQLSPAGQTFPQAPQLLGSTPVSTSQPLATMPSQLPKPARQAPMLHAPDAQTGSALG